MKHIHLLIKKKKLLYKVGEKVEPDGFNNNLNEECGQGINVHLYQDHCDQWFVY